MIIINKIRDFIIIASLIVLLMAIINKVLIRINRVALQVTIELFGGVIQIDR